MWFPKQVTEGAFHNRSLDSAVGDDCRRTGYRNAISSRCSTVQAASCAREEKARLPSALLTCISTVRSESTSCSAIALLLSPCATSATISRSRAVSGLGAVAQQEQQEPIVSEESEPSYAHRLLRALADLI
jgi:hypothetical protein